MPGSLFIVATPIGNLEDITLRALRVLREADLIACEDTRQTQKLLHHYDIRRPLVSYHEHNEAAQTAALLERLQQGETVALVSDAGTPLISDPGYRIVHAARAAGLPVVPIPGPSAVMAALSAAGLPTDAFLFAGFAPAKTGARRRWLEEQRNLAATLVFYEAPHRIVETLEDIAEVLGNAPVVLAREITKLHEEFLTGTASEVAGQLRGRPTIKGEFTVLVGRSAPSSENLPEPAEAVAQLIATGVSRMDALKQVARERGLSKREVYRLFEEQE